MNVSYFKNIVSSINNNNNSSKRVALFELSCFKGLSEIIFKLKLIMIVILGNGCIIWYSLQLSLVSKMTDEASYPYSKNFSCDPKTYVYGVKWTTINLFNKVKKVIKIIRQQKQHNKTI